MGTDVNYSYESIQISHEEAAKALGLSLDNYLVLRGWAGIHEALYSLVKTRIGVIELRDDT